MPGTVTLANATDLHQRIRALQHSTTFSSDAREQFVQYSRELLRIRDSIGEDQFHRSAARLIEIGDFLGRCQEDLQPLCVDGERLFDGLPPEAPDEAEWQRLKLDSVLRYCLACIQATDYRKRNYKEAIKRLDRCRSLLVEGPSIQSKALRARVYLQLGHAHRNSGDFVSARARFSESLRHRGLWMKAAFTAQLPTDLFDTITAVTLTGMASVEIRSGSITRALSFVHLAMDVVPHGNRLLDAMVQLTYGSALRAHASGRHDRRGMLEKAIRRLNGAQATFLEYGHLRNATRAALELAKAHISMKDRAAARSHLNSVELRAKEIRDERWKCDALLLKSQIAGELDQDYAQAAESAQTALDSANAAKLRVQRVEALIALGTAMLGQVKPDHAHRLLEQAFSEANSQRQRAVSSLLRARALLQLGQPERALQSLELGEELSQPLELSAIHVLAEQVRREYESTSLKVVLVIDPDTSGLNYQYYEEKLREALVKIAMKRSSNLKKKAAGQLKVTRTTLNTWIDDLKIKFRD